MGVHLYLSHVPSAVGSRVKESKLLGKTKQARRLKFNKIILYLSKSEETLSSFHAKQLQV